MLQIPNRYRLLRLVVALFLVSSVLEIRSAAPDKPASAHATPVPTTETSNTDPKPAESENELTIGKGRSGNLVLKSAVDYEKSQNSDAVKKLEGIRDLRGGTNQWSEVARLLQEVLATDANKTIKRNVQQLALLELAGIAERSGQLPYAQQLLAEYIERYSTDPIIPEILLRQGYLYREMVAPVMAVSKFYLVMTAALRLKGNLAYYQRVVLTAQSEIAETKYAEGKFDEAADFYLILLKQGSEELNYVAVKTKLIRSLSRAKGRQADVIKQATDFLNQHGSSDSSAEVRYLLASAFKASGEKQQALQQLLLLLEAVEVADVQRSANWKSWKMLAGNEIGNQLFLEGDYVHAVQVYRGLLDLDNSLTWKLPIYYQIGLCSEHNLQPDEAVKAYAEIVNLSKKSEAKLDESLQMVVDMARVRMEVHSWRGTLDRATAPMEKKVAEKTK